MVHGRFSRLVTVPRLAAGAAFLLIASVVFLLSGGHGSSFQDQLRAGEHPQSPAFMLRIAWPRINTWPTGAEAADHHGQISIDDLRGYPVVLVFWNTSCVRCAQEARVYAVESRRYSGKAVFLGVSVLDLTPTRLLAPANVPFPSLDDVDRRVPSYMELRPARDVVARSRRPRRRLQERACVACSLSSKPGQSP